MRNFILLVLIFGLFSGIIFAQETSNPQTADLQKRIKELREKLGEVRQQKNTLSSQIQYMDNQIYLTNLTIQDTEQKIENTAKEIGVIETRIDGLDSSLNYLSKMLVKRVSEGYKKRSVSLFTVLFDSSTAQDLFDRIKYLKNAQNNNQKLIIQVQEAKLNFEEQKTLREEKKSQLDSLKITLAQQKINLLSQQQAKQRLLATTKNDENTYQNLLAVAEAQLQAFKSFVISAGAGVISSNQFGNGSDGNYYSQRDSRWAYKTIGYSNETVLDVGCLISSVAMTAKKFGSNVSPLDIASETNRFFGYTAWMNYPWPGVAGKSMVNVNNIDDEINNGNYVIVGVKQSSCANGGDHYVVLIKKDGNDYIMHDPIYGPDKKFNDHYSTICSSATFK